MVSHRYDLEAEFDFIKAHLEEKFYPPTDKEIALHFNMKKTTVAYHRTVMQTRGWLTWRKYRPRTIRITR